jgi:hypothetical protein
MVKDIDYGWKRLKRDFKLLNNSYTKVGVSSNKMRTTEKGEPITMVQVAAINEFGTKDGRIPPRPFLRNAFDKNVKNINTFKKKLVTKLINRETSPKKALALLGEFITNKVKTEIRNLKYPPNALSTILKKGSDNPLIDEGQLIQSIEHIEVIR